MACSYEEVSGTRRVRLPVETRSDRAVFEQTYRLVRRRASAEVW